MPGRDRTGPMGAGPLTGRGMGYGNPNVQQTWPNWPAGVRYGAGFRRGGGGFGWRNRYYATGVPGWVPPTDDQQIADLKAQSLVLREQLDAVEKQLTKLENKESE